MTFTPSKVVRTLCVALLLIAFCRALLPIPSKPLPQDNLFEDVVVRIQQGEQNQKLTLSSGVLAFVPSHSDLTYGDRIQISCQFSHPEPFDGFAYDKYLATKGIHTLCFSHSSPVVIDVYQGSWLMGKLQSVRSVLMTQIDRVYGEPHASLLAGLLFGENRFSDEWQERFVRTGTSHIVAASGYNVAMVLLLAGGMFAFFGIRRPRAFLLLIGAVVGYMLFAALETAVVRAGVMALLMLLARQLGRKTSMVTVLLLTAATMLTINPYLLFYDVAFSLSFLSTIGLIYLAPIWQRSWIWIPERFMLRESLASTASATLMSLPILLYQFKHLSLLSISSNVLILPTIPFVMATGAVSIVVSFVSIDAARFIGLPAIAGMNWMLWIVQVSSDLPLYVSISAGAIAIGIIGWVLFLRYVWKQNVSFNSLALQPL